MIRRHVALAAAAAGMLAGCSSEVPKTPISPAVADAGKVDMCAILTDAELTKLGIELKTRKQTDMLGLIGCHWQGEHLTLDLQRDRDTVASYKARQPDPAFTTFAENTVNGRAGVRFSVDPDRTDCTQLIDGGSVSLWIAVAPAFSLDGPKINSCTEALRIAQLIEPRLPKPGE
ncbi:MAG: DUF3558 family protein [Pseudonocardiaceae bacterium]